MANSISVELNDNPFGGCLAGGGEMGQLIREYNWSETPVGQPALWPQSLRTTLSIILNSKFPMFLVWGQELICFYNDAYRPSLGNDGKHPGALGKPAEAVWAETWSVTKPLIDQVLYDGEATWSEDRLIPIYRNGRMEDVYWTFSMSPLKDETGKIAGVFVTCTETTSNVIELQKSRDELTFAIEATELATWNLNLKTNKFRFNKRLKEWFGISPQDEDEDGEVELALAVNAVADTDKLRVVEAFKIAMQPSSGGYFFSEYTITNPITKQERIIRSKGKTLFTSDGIPYRFTGTIQDITIEASGIKRLEASEAKLRSVIEHAPAVMSVFVGRDLIIENPNQAFITVLGKGPDIAGKPLREVMPELITENQPFLQILDDVYTSGKMYQAFGTQVKIVQDGVMTYNYYNFTYSPLFDFEGNVYGILDISIDVTEEIKSRLKLEESEARFRSVADKSPMIVFIVDADAGATVSFWSKTWLEYTGQTYEQAIGRGWDGIVHTDDLQSVLDIYALAFQNQVPYTIPAVRLRRHDGEYRWHLFKANTRNLPNDEFMGFIGIGLDIHEQKQTEDELKVKNQELLRINNELDNFIYTASHDLKAPISNIEGLLNAFTSNENFKPQQRELIEMMYSSIERFKATILDLTEISKIQSLDETDLKILTFDQILYEVNLDIRELLIFYKPEIIIDFKVEEIYYSKKNLRSIIYNLVSNALKYSSPDRELKIEITTERIDGYVILKVIDNGLGLSVENQNKIFGIFKRAHLHVEGSGIGLYMIRKMVDNSAGKIEVESEVGKGSCFKVYFKD